MRNYRNSLLRFPPRFRPRSWQWPAIGIGVITGMLAVPVPAHHSFAVHFVSDRIVTVSGAVTRFKFVNPHGILYVAVTDADGEVQEWSAETNSPNILVRRGWTKDSFKAGDEVTVEGWPARDGVPRIRIRRVTFADGRSLRGQGGD